ncbi:choice-of-anchor A family protein [Microbacterium sp. LMI12-1-1.1]|uniref:collagen-binding domain-containing protein n=1 Tax=Microbacterium sp. LMI12-1-1.1 TaxID=3135225 RepID=UPI00341F5F3F
MVRTERPRLRRWIAGVVATLLATTGAVTAGIAQPAPAQAAYPETVNPFAIAGGFTVYAREDALLQNQETEGSIAVGGTATVAPAAASQYAIIHVSAGTGDYDLPRVDGDPTRFLVGEYSTASTGILAITSAGTSDPALWGDLKMADRDGGWQAFARADWLRLNQNPANPDQTPLIDSTHQQYPEDAAPPSGAAGNNSIFTANTSATAVADYVEANRDASWEEASSCLDDIADPIAGVGYPVEVAEDAGSRVVLAPLSADQPNIVDYANIAGTALIQFSPGPTPGVSNPLVIRVPAGTTDVVGARADPQGAFSPYMLWDLSQLTGDVTVTAAEARIDGSIYAPEASVTVDAAPLDGQVIGRNVTLQGGETHSFLFSSEISCSADSGTFAVRKELSGIAPDDLPAGTTFTVNYIAAEPDGTVATGTLEVPADGTPVVADSQFPIGTTVEFEEIAPESVPGWLWGDPTIDPNPLTIGAGTAQVVVTNTATAQTGTFSIAKSIEDVSGGQPGEPSQPTVPVAWTATFGGEQIGSGTLDVPFDGTVVDVGQDFPVGTVIVLTEELDGIEPPVGYEWAGAHWTPGRTFVIGETGTVAVELVNAVTPAETERTITIVKSALGDAADPAYEFAVSYNTDPPGTRTTRVLPVGDPELLDDVEAGAEALQLAELIPTVNGTPVDPDDWFTPVIRVTVDGVVTEYRPGNFEGAGPLETAIVSIPLPESGDIAIEVVNALRQGTFDVAKAFTGIPPESVPSGLEVTVTWTATLPTGAVETGTMRVSGDGTPVSPVDDRGAPLTFPFGTVVTFEEQAAPAVRGVMWGPATFDPDELVIGADGELVVSTTLTNDATLITGTFQVVKDLVGIDPDELLVDSFTVAYIAHIPGQDPVTGTFSLPADGTPAGPVDETGAPLEFPIGTAVDLAETEVEASALPPGFEWGETIWSPSSHVVVEFGTTPVLEVTNTAVELTRWAVTKVVDGDAASAVPSGTTFPVDWWWDGVAQPRVELTPNVPVYSPYFPVGTILEVQEGELPSVPGVDWGAPVWTVDGETLTPEANGRTLLPMSVARDTDVAELTLTNTAVTRPLPATGGGAISPLVPIGSVVLIALGALLATRRTQRTRRT